VPTLPRVPIVLACCCCCCRRAPSGTFRSADMSIEDHVMRLFCRQCPTACFLRLVHPTTRKKCQFSAKVLACCCCCWRRAPGIFRSADMSIEDHVMPLSRKQCPTACFLRLVRPTTRQKCQFNAKVLTRCCCYCRMAPSGIFRSADMSIDAHVKRLCREQCCTACFWRLLCLLPLENDKFTWKIGHM